MINRPKPKYFRTFYKDGPPDKDRRKLIFRFKKGGLKSFEDDVADRMCGVSLDQYSFTDPYTKEVLKWIYVGNFWWCRFRKWGVKDISANEFKKIKVNKYEFARLLAGSCEKIFRGEKNANNHGVIQYDGLWDSRRHEFKQMSEVVFDKSGKKGVILGHNEWEVVVGWVHSGKIGVGVPVRNPDELTFMFVEDFVKYKKIFELVRKHVKKVL
jgi:hypothetical protein